MIIALTLSLAYAGILREAAILAARIAGIGLVIETLRVIRRPRRPVPIGSPPLVHWTHAKLAIATVLVVVGGLVALVAIGLIAD